MKRQKLISINKKLRIYAFSLTNNNYNADDLCQDTLYKMLQVLNRYSLEEIEPIAMTTMRYTHYNNHKAKRDYVYEVLETEEHIEADSLTIVNSIHTVIDGLTEKLSTAIYLYSQGYKYKEIAEKLDIPIDTVKTRIYLARKKLQPLFI